MNRVRTSLLYPHGTYQQQSFFWRGDDEFKEVETIQNQHTQAKSELSRAKHELEAARAEYNNVLAVYENKEQHAVALAQSLGNESSTTSESANLRRRIAELTLDIEDLEHRIEDAKIHSLPSTIEQLDREKSQLFLSVEKLRSKYEETQQKILKQQIDLFSILVSQDWREAITTSAEHQIAFRIKQQLSNSVQCAFEKQNFPNFPVTQKKQTPTNSQKDTKEAKDLQILLQKRSQLVQQCNEAAYKRNCAQIRRRVIIASMLDDLQRLDSALKSLGKEGLNIDQLKRSYLPEGPLSPLKRPKSSVLTARGRTELSPLTTGRSKSDIKRPFATTRDNLSPLGGSRRKHV